MLFLFRIQLVQLLATCLFFAFLAGNLTCAKEHRSMVMMGQLGRLVDGLRSKMRAGSGGKKGTGKKAAAAAAYEQMGKTESMRVEIKSRQAQKLIAKNLVAADSIGRRSRNKRFFLAF
uniref:Uncharacterized protein n=2 Tax=Aegilops tauschii subsp. strangulata TaxID=200361 RepID=A0A453D7R3_AEGTS